MLYFADIEFIDYFKNEVIVTKKLAVFCDPAS